MAAKGEASRPKWRSRALLRVCNVHNVPLATNLGTADLIITALTPLMAGRRGPADPA